MNRHGQGNYSPGCAKLIYIDTGGITVGIHFTDRSLAPRDLPDAPVAQAYPAVQAFAQEICNPGSCMAQIAIEYYMTRINLILRRANANCDIAACQETNFTTGHASERIGETYPTNTW